MNRIVKFIKSMFTYKVNLGRAHDYTGVTSGQALILEQQAENLSPAAKLAIVQELLGGEETCPTCGHTTERPALITEDQAWEMLGFKK